MPDKEINKPYYELFPSLNTSAIIFVDDVPVFSFLGEETNEGIYDGTVPINHILLQSGVHEVVGKLYPRFGHKTLTENDGINIKFNVSDFDNWKETKQSFFPELNSPDAYFNADKKITSAINGLPTFEIKTEIKTELPYILNGWQKSINLKTYDKTILKNKVYEYYIQIHAILASGNASKYLEISKEKEELQTQAFYFDENKKQEIRKSIVDLFARNLELLPINENELIVELMGYGKLVRLTRLDGSSALQFKKIELEKEKKIELEIKLHMRTLEKGFTII